MKISHFLLASSIAVFTACNSENSENIDVDAEDVVEEIVEETATEEENENLMVPEGAKVFFVNLEDGAVVSSPFTVEFGIEGMEVVPAGAITPGTGHHHIIVNEGHISKGDVIGSEPNKYIHYGGGQTSAELDLEPGNYTLTMQFANGIHESYGEQMSATVEVTVQ